MADLKNWVFQHRQKLHKQSIEETIETKEVKPSGNTDEISLLEHQEPELSMDCWLKLSSVHITKTQ